MNKRIFIIHAWDESPQSCWYPWLKQELEARGADVRVPAMPNPSAPDIEAWVGLLGNLADADEHTYFIGHSIGCQTILRYLARLSDDKRVGGAFFVAPWTHLVGLSGASRHIAQLWLETPIDWQAAKAHCPRLFALFSDNDPWVPLGEEKVFREKLGATTKTMHQKGHFDTDEQFPELLEEIFAW